MVKRITSGFMILAFALSAHTACAAGKIIEERGGKKSKAVKYENGDWELIVDGKPYYIRGLVFSPVVIGESPGENTMRDWMYYDEDKNGKNDIACDVWVDANKNNKRDPDEKAVGDFQILKDMGCNTIRLYQVPSNNPLLGDIYKKNPSHQLQYDHAVNKELLRQLYRDYGIRVIMGHFMGSWTVGSGTTWEQGCDYTDPVQRENIKKSVRAMVEDNKDEPYVLMWLLGNENNIATWSKCNASGHMKEYLTLVNECAVMIKEIDPDHLVGICEGFRGNHLPLYREYLSDIDIIGFNTYMGKWGFATMWKQTKRDFDRPVFLTEYGIFAYNKNKGEDEDMQLEYHQGCYKDMENNRAGANPPAPKKSSGNCVGGCIFDYLDRWYMDGAPYEHNPGTRYWDSPDRLDHEEYFGITSMGDGKDNIFKRQLRKAYEFYKENWRAKPEGFRDYEAGAKFVPPDGKILLIVGQDKGSINEYVNGIGIIPGGLMFYTSIQQLEGIYEPIDYGAGTHYGQYLAEKYPVTAMQVGLWMVDVLEKVIGGDLDENIDKLGEWIKGLKRPVYLRIGYEFDFPGNHYEPKKYIEAFKHIVDKLRKNGVDNVAFVWHSYASLNSRDVMQWYPGDDYVDWFAVSYFAQDKKYMQAIAALAKEHKKPLMIAEATPFGTQTKFGERSWNNWFEKFFKFVSDYDVKAISYINYDWESHKTFKGQGWGDARVEANDIVKAKWLEEIKKEKYLQSSPGLFRILGYSR